LGGSTRANIGGKGSRKGSLVGRFGITKRSSLLARSAVFLGKDPEGGKYFILTWWGPGLAIQFSALKKDIRKKHELLKGGNTKAANLSI